MLRRLMGLVGTGHPLYNAWDPTHKGTNITLSNSDRTASIANALGAQSVLAVYGKLTGNWMWEVTVDSIGSGIYLGVALQTTNLNQWLGAVADMWTFGAPAIPGGTISNHVGESGFENIDGNPTNGLTTGTIATLTVNCDTGDLRIYQNGVGMYYQQFGGGAHVNNIMAKVPYAAWSGTIYPCFLLNNTAGGTRQVTANFGQTDFVHPVVGYRAIHGPTT